jgi:hypothetical protein
MHPTLLDEEKKLADYWQSLGRFIDAFSRVEQCLLWTLEVYSGVSTQVSRALFSGVRTDAAMGYINRILEATKATKTNRDHAQWLFTQLGHINKLRNDLVHYGVKDHGGTAFLVSNKSTALNNAGP